MKILPDPIGALVYAHTGRTLDQHAVDILPIPAQPPAAAELVRRCRHELTLAIDDLYQWLSSQSDVYPDEGPEGIAAELAPMVQSLTQFAELYLQSRAQLDTLLGHMHNSDIAGHAPQQVRRHYIDVGMIVAVTLPATPVCRAHHIAGRTTLVSVTDVDAQTDVMIDRNALRLAHHDAGIYRDPATGRLYTLQTTAA